MRKYVKNMIDEFPVNIEKYQAVNIIATEKLFKVDGIKTTEKNKRYIFHRTGARGLFLCKLSILENKPTIAVLFTRVKQINQG